MKRQEIEDKKNRLSSIILDREAKLKEYDYVSAKIADGRADIDEYVDIIANKSKWAEDINKANDEIAYLNSVAPDDAEHIIE